MATRIDELNKIKPKLSVVPESKNSEPVDWYAQYRALGASPQKAVHYATISEGKNVEDTDIDFSKIRQAPAGLTADCNY